MPKDKTIATSINTEYTSCNNGSTNSNDSIQEVEKIEDIEDDTDCTANIRLD